jgi:hypothetical protein
MRRLNLAPFILIGSLAFGSVAQAGCCDDFWGCLATVATGGLSCQIQGIINTVKTLNDTVSTLFNDLKNRSAEIISDARKAVEQAATDVKQIREQSLAELADAANRAHVIANPQVVASAPIARRDGIALAPNAAATQAKLAPAAAIATPQTRSALAMQPIVPPADPNAIKTALRQADTYVQELKTKATPVSNDGVNAEKQALNAVARHVLLAQRIALDTALEPLRLLGESLVDLLTHPERIFDPSAQIEADLRRISNEIPAMLDRIGNEVAQEATANLDSARKPAQQLQDQAAAANNILEAMQKLADNRSQSELDALNKLLPAVNAQKVVVLHGVMLPAGIAGRHELLTAAVGRLQVAKLPVIAKHRAAVSSIVSQWSKIQNQTKLAIKVDAATTQHVNGDLSQHFRGKSPAEAEKKKHELLEEAKRRFANQPRTLEKVQQYIEAHSK